MTNLEYMLACLTSIKENCDIMDDGGASEEACVYYNINCPYYTDDKRAKCYDNIDFITREMCVRCKYEWLNQEVDT